MMCRTGADGDPSVADVPVGAQSGGAMARTPSGRTDHRAAAGGERTVTRSHKTVAAAMGCDSCTRATTAAEAAKVTDNMAAGTTGSTTDNGMRAADTAAARMAECTTAARSGSTGNPDTAHLGHGEAAGVTWHVHGILGGAGRSIFLRDVIHRLLTARKHVVHLRGGPNRWIEGPAPDACGAVPPPEPSPCRMIHASSMSALEKKSRSSSCGASPFPPTLQRECPPNDGTQPPRYHRLRQAVHPKARSRTCPPPAVGYPGTASAPSFRGRGHRADHAAADPRTRIDDACNRLPCGILLRWPAWVVGGNDLNLMLWAPPVAPKPVPVRKLSGPPLVVAPGRHAIEPLQVHRVQWDGLLTTELPLHAINMVEPHVHEKNNGNRRELCLYLSRLGDPVRL
ncbi:hypothetical protein PIB30_061228 [Stylosanthes scabra]|uniref:Uncharacterized protein n=1 Tax=Stylosanthes scabra TaxID=79078 RepID=A0ABU6SM52_9FABA|nr:hypothetical protein [Stylosanthes scabra]